MKVFFNNSLSLYVIFFITYYVLINYNIIAYQFWGLEHYIKLTWFYMVIIWLIEKIKCDYYFEKKKTIIAIINRNLKERDQIANVVIKTKDIVYSEN